MIGLFGDIRFKVSERSVLTFRNLKREISATWNTMDRIGQKPLMEFGGPDLQTASLEINPGCGFGSQPVRAISNTGIHDRKWKRL